MKNTFILISVITIYLVFSSTSLFSQITSKYVITLDSGFDLVGEIVKFENFGLLLQQQGYNTQTIVKYSNIIRIRDFDGNDTDFLIYDSGIKSDNKKLTRYRVMNKLNDYPDLQKEFSKGNTLKGFGTAFIVFTAIGAGLVIAASALPTCYLCTDPQPRESSDYIVPVTTILLSAAGAIILKSTGSKKHRNVVRDFNNRTNITENLPNNKSTATLTFYGTGLVLTF